MNKDSYTPCTKCGRPMRYCKGECCGKKPEGCDCREYGCKHNACIREKNPECPYEAVIPSVTVETIDNLKDLADCFVHVEDINTTFYIDDKHRIMVTWAGLVSADDYDFDANPLNVRSQIIYDAKNNKAAIYDRKGAHYIFQISDIDNNYLLLENKPQINGVTLEGNKTAADLDMPKIEEVAMYFDTVADMKASTLLKDGGYAHTLGFHAANDDGGATYKIRTITNDDVVDGGSIIAMEDDTLVAELIKDGVINVKQFGAYGDGAHDDGTAIQAAIDYIDNQAHELGRSMADNQLQVPAGKYKITNTVKLKTTVKLRTIGMASFEYYGNDVCIWIMNDWTSAPDDRFSAGEWLEGALIDGVGLNIKNMNAADSGNAHDRGNTTALEVGVRSSTAYNGYNRVSIYTINHVKISNFNLAIKINSIFTFVCNYECVDILRCNTCVEFGTTGVSVNNGTEKLSFTSCMIGGGVDVGFKWNAAPIHVSFYNCSLDYMNAVFVDSASFNNPNNIAVFGGHIEGIGEGLDNNPSGMFGLVDGYFNKSTIVINSPLLAIANEPKIINSSTLASNLRVIFNSVEMNYSGGSITKIGPDNAFISNIPIEVNTINANSYINDYADGTRSILMRTLSPYNSLFADDLLQNATEGSFSISNNTQVDSFIIKSSGNITSGTVTTDNPITGGKVMTLTPSNATSTFVIKTVKIRADSNTWYKANFITKGTSSRGITFTFYDRDDNQLFESNESVSNLNIDASKWYQAPYSKICKAPSGADYMVVSFKCVSQNNTGLNPIKIAGCFVEKIS